jgi:hypothetical protein
MSTRSRANPWFRPVAPIAKAYVEGVMRDAAFEARIKAIVVPRPVNYDEQCQAMTRALIRSRLDNKLVLTARLLDSDFDRRVRALCPELPRLEEQGLRHA